MTTDAARTAVNRILDDLHRQGGYLEVSQVERVIIKRELNPDEAAFVYSELSNVGVTLNESEELSALLSRPLSRASEVPWESNFARMLSEAREYRPLWPEQEVRLGRRVVQARTVSAEVESGRLERTPAVEEIIARGEEARMVLAKSNLRFVVTVAREFQGVSSLGMDDLVQEGLLGLLKGIDRYDPDRGYKLITYAVWWIRQALIQATNDVGHIVRLPLNVKNDVAKLRKVRRRLQRLAGGRPPDLGELAAALEWDESRVDFLLEVASYRSESLDRPLTEHSSVDRTEVLPLGEPSPEALLMDYELTRTIQEVLVGLQHRDREIITRYFGLDGQEPMTLESIGTVFGVTRERIRQLRNRTLEKLREHPRLRGLGRLSEEHNGT